MGEECKRNTSDLEEPVRAMDLIVTSFELVIMSLVLCGSTLVLLAIYRYRALRNLTNVFIANLALADLVVSLSIPFLVVTTFDKSLQNYKYVCLLRFATVEAGLCESAFSLLLIAVERTITILYPLHSHAMLSQARVMMAIGGSWVYAVLLVTLPLMGWNTWCQSTGSCKIEEVFTAGYLWLLSLHFFLLGLALILMYARISVIARKHRADIRRDTVWAAASESRDALESTVEHHVASKPRLGMLNRRAKVTNKHTKMVGLVLGAYLIFWTPYFILISAHACLNLVRPSSPPNDVLSDATVCAAVLGMANSIMNPVIYAWKNANFRMAFKKLFRCRSISVTS